MKISERRVIRPINLKRFCISRGYFNRAKDEAFEAFADEISKKENLTTADILDIALKLNDSSNDGNMIELICNDVVMNACTISFSVE